MAELEADMRSGLEFDDAQDLDDYRTMLALCGGEEGGSTVTPGGTGSAGSMPVAGSMPGGGGGGQAQAEARAPPGRCQGQGGWVGGWMGWFG